MDYQDNIISTLHSNPRELARPNPTGPPVRKEITMSGPILRPGGWVIQPMGPSPIGGDIHDTFQVDVAGNISGGHTTIQTSQGKIRMSW